MLKGSRGGSRRITVRIMLLSISIFLRVSRRRKLEEVLAFFLTISIRRDRILGQLRKVLDVFVALGMSKKEATQH